VQYFVGPDTVSTIGEVFVRQGLLNDETDTEACLEAFERHAQAGGLVVDPCATGTCEAVGPGEIDERELRCGPLDDLAMALVGMHPKDVWLTRLESNLSRLALSTDLTVAPAQDQSPVENWILAEQSFNAPCPLAGALPPRPEGRGARPSPGAAFALIGGIVALLLGLRRLARPIGAPQGARRAA
jgi:hypothetical protein